MRPIVARLALRSINGGFSRWFKASGNAKSLSTDTNWFESPEESADDFERRIFGDLSGSGSGSGSGSSSSSSSDSFFEKLDRLQKARNGPSAWRGNGYGRQEWEDMDERLDTLADGMDEELQRAATYFDFDVDEVDREDYTFRPDATFHFGSTYDIKDLDLTKPGVRKPPPREDQFSVTTEEVLMKADFRNVRFLANFLTEAGIIIKRSKTGISAKAQRKVAREIKTARAFGLMPFTTMGSKSFIFGKSMEDLAADYEYESFNERMGIDENVDPLEN